MLLRTLRWPLLITLGALIAVLGSAGPAVALTVAILAVLEVSLSFDNAVVNAKVLGKMSAYWQKIFLTVGIAIAVFGMRLVFPVLVVALAAQMGPLTVINMALAHPSDYATHLMAAHAAIAGFGGMFLWMIFLDFVFEDREIKWLGPLEHAAARLELANKHHALTTTIAGITLMVLVLANEVAGNGALFGLITYLAVSWLSDRFELAAGTVARAGFASFVYLEVLDASFSFDGVTGAFAVSNQILVIALGLGLGALFVRSLTVYLVRAGKLAEYRYLEHGAHYAIGALALLLFVSVGREIPELVTGLIGVAFIAAAFAHSVIANRRDYDNQENSRRGLPRSA